MNQKRIFEALKYVPLGGFSFWAPDVVLHWLRGDRFSRLDVLVLSALLPIITALVVTIVWKRCLDAENHLLDALSALLGIWLLGPLMMLVGAGISGGGFSQPDGFWHAVLTGTRFFPASTYMMSAYDGTLGALLLATLLLPFLPALYSFIERRHLRDGATFPNPPLNRL